MCVLTNKRLIHIKQDFCSDACVMPKVRDCGVPGVPSGSKKNFFEHGHVAYQIAPGVGLREGGGGSKT